MTGISASSLQTATQQAIQSLTQPKHRNHQSLSISDVGAQGTDLSAMPSSTGKVGSTVNITA